MGFPGGSVVNNLPANAGDSGDTGSIPGSGRSPGLGNGNPLQYSCLGNPMDGGAWWATVCGVIKSWAWLSNVYEHACVDIWYRYKLIYRHRYIDRDIDTDVDIAFFFFQNGSLVDRQYHSKAGRRLMKKIFGRHSVFGDLKISDSNAADTGSIFKRPTFLNFSWLLFISVSKMGVFPRSKCL